MTNNLTLKIVIVFFICFIYNITSYSQNLINDENIEKVRIEYFQQTKENATFPEKGFRGEHSPYAMLYLYSQEYPNPQDFSNPQDLRIAREEWLSENLHRISEIQSEINLYNERFTIDYKEGVFN